MKIQVTRADVEKAIERRNTLGSQGLCKFCPVWQALCRHGVPIDKVFLRQFLLSDGTLLHLPEEAQRATNVGTTEWEDIPNFEFEIPEVK